MSENRIPLNKKQYAPIVSKTFPEYNGRKVFLKFAEEVEFYDTNSSGGTVNRYAFLGSNGLTVNLKVPAPWVNTTEGAKFQIPVNVLVVEHSYFCGHDCGITIYSNPANAPKVLES